VTDLSEYKSLFEWCKLDGLNYSTITKRRRQSGVGARVNARLWMLDKGEWEKVKKTPLPGCVRLR
jgi:hypothetical protein